MALPKKLVSIDIGNERIKIINTVRSGRKIRVEKQVIIPTPNQSINDGIISNSVAISESIREALREHKIGEKDLVFTISSTKIITREVEIPFVRSNKLADVININAEEYFPVNLAEYILGYTVAENFENDNGKQMKVLVYAAMISMIEAYVELAQTIGLNVVAIDYFGNSIVNFVKHEHNTGVNMYLDLGSESTHVTIMEDEDVKFSRSVLFGTKPLNETICSHFDVAYDEATKISKEQNLLFASSGESSSHLSAEITDSLENILSGIARLVDYFTSRNKITIEHIYIYGGGSEIHSIDQYIQQFFNVETTKMLSFKNIVYKGVNEKEAVSYPSAIGAVLTNLNLLPKKVIQKDKLVAKNRIPYLLFLLAVSIIILFDYQNAERIKSLKVRKDTLTSEIARMQDIDQIIQEHNAYAELGEFYKDVSKKATTKTDMTYVLLEEFEQNLPSTVVIESMQVSTESIMLLGTADSDETIGQLLSYLKNITIDADSGETEKVFQEVEIPGITRTTIPAFESETGEAISEISFQIILTFMEEKSEEEATEE